MAVPKLRFKEFDGAYKLRTIKSIAQIFVGRDLVEEAFSQTKTDTHIYPIYSNSVDKEGLYGYYNFKEFNFSDDALTIVGRGAGLGTAFYRREGFGTIGRLLCLTPKNKQFHPKYLADYVNDKLVIHNESGGIPQLPRASLEQYEVVIPDYNEQTKIASFLSQVDEKISQLSQKHELLSQYKQGMMQKLFSQQIRFKADDGSDFGEWEEKALIDSVDSNTKWGFTGGPFGSNLKSDDYTEFGIRIIQLQNIGDGLFLNEYKIFTSLEKANELLSCNIYPNEILISKMGDPVARCCIVPDYHDRYVMCSDGIRLVVDKSKYSSNFMFYQINYQEFRQQASDVSTGSTRKRIGLSELKKLPIKVPYLEEQTKIANFLSAIDQKIEVVSQQIEQTKQWKKGLLQQMFV